MLRSGYVKADGYPGPAGECNLESLNEILGFRMSRKSSEFEFPKHRDCSLSGRDPISPRTVALFNSILTGLLRTE